MSLAGALRAVIASLLLLAGTPACEEPPGEAPRQDATVDAVSADESIAGETVQVIVRLRFEPPAGASPGSDAHAQAIAATRNRFLEGLAVPHRVLRTHDTVPVVVLTVPAAQLSVLEGSPLVASVEEDRLNVPLAR